LRPAIKRGGIIKEKERRKREKKKRKKKEEDLAPSRIGGVALSGRVVVAILYQCAQFPCT